ncbi:MAG TPA: catalase, partial [Acidobacteriaceae bacterium]|nr:catalase [Acidobacteriaceae bacterium]
MTSKGLCLTARRKIVTRSVLGIGGLFIGLTQGHGATDATLSPSQMIKSFEGTFGVHPGVRRNHTKGTCATGEFFGEPAAQEFSRSAMFSGARIPVLARFSVGGGNPNVADVDASLPRGMALEYRMPGDAIQHMTMVNTPVFNGATPASFNDAIVASRPDPLTGKPDPEKLKTYMDTHPDAQPL